MKSKCALIIFFFLCSCLNTLSQKIDFNKPPWEIGCDSLSTQTEMNFCSYEKYRIADSILNSYYDILINLYDSNYKHEFQLFKDTTDALQQEDIIRFEKAKQSLIKSKNDFYQYLYSTLDLVESKYEGGTIRPLMVNTYAFNMTLEQIKILIYLNEEIFEK